MKHLIIILALLTATIQTFAQSPRIKLNQITKDSVTGSVLISSPTDSGMVYSRDLFISYGVSDTVLILGGDTLAKTSGIISSVLSDGVTITGDGTSGSELTADTSVLATLKALSDSLALVISSVTADNVTITGDGTVGSPLTVDTTTYIATKADLDAKQDQLNGTGFVKATGTTISYDNSTYLTSEVDGSTINEIQDISTTGAAGNITISSGSTLNLNVDDADASATNEGSLTVGAGTASTSVISSNTSGSTDVTLTAGSNITLSETGNNITIAATGGGTTYNNISETADTLYVAKYLDVDTSTLYVDATTNRVGIGTSTPENKVEIIKSATRPSLASDTDDGNLLLTSENPIEHMISMYSASTDNQGPKFYSAKSRGTMASPTNAIDGDLLFGFNALAYNTDGGVSSYKASALFQVRRDNTTGSSTRAPGYFQFRVIDDDVSTIIDGMTIGKGGVVKMPKVYSDLISGTTRDLYIKDDGTLGYISSTVKSKININPLNDIDFIYDLNPVTFNYRKQDEQGNFTNEYYDKTSYGLIAEEVESVADYMVYYDETEEGNVAVGINYSELITPLLKAIQDQKTEIEQLKTLITELSNRLTILENN